jgi:hypothetical protein
MRQPIDVSRQGFILIFLVWHPAFLLRAADPTLRIVAPAEGTVVRPGQTFTVDVESDSKFELVGVIGEGPLGSTEARRVPPYRFTMKTPSRPALRLYMITAVAYRQSGDMITSAPINVDVERLDYPQKLVSIDSGLSFRRVGEEYALSINGIFDDNLRDNVTRSTRTKYSSTDPLVVAVRDDGVATAIGPGFAKIIVVHGPVTLTVPVGVPPSGKR